MQSRVGEHGPLKPEDRKQIWQPKEFFYLCGLVNTTSCCGESYFFEKDVELANKILKNIINKARQIYISFR